MSTPTSVATEHVSILTVAQMLGMAVPGDIPTDGSIKVLCPFGEFFHSDGGRSAAMRLYGSGTAFCFAGDGFFTSVSLYAKAKDLSNDEAALELLTKTNQLNRLTSQDAWANVIRPVKPELPSLADLAAALKLACAQAHPDWEALQFEDRVADLLEKCLALLPQVYTRSQAERWLDRTKAVMRETLETNLH